MTGWLLNIGASVAVVVIVAFLTKAPARARDWLRRRIQPDHASLSGSGPWGLHATRLPSSLDGVRVRVVAAPDRALPQDRQLEPDKAIRFARDHFPGFPADPAFSTPNDGVRFDDPRGLDWGYLWVWRTGRVDLDLYVPAQIDGQDRALIPVLDLLAVIDRLGAAIGSTGYAAVFGHARPFRRRFDWFITVSTTLTRPDGRDVHWDGLVFPGRQPQRAAGSAQRSFCPVGGYAAQALRGWHPGREGAPRLRREFLRDFLAQNGYHDTDAAIADTLAAYATPPT